MPPVTIPIACAINGSYLLPLAVMLESVREHLRAGSRPHLYLIHSGLPPESIALISSIASTEPILLSPERLAATPQSRQFPPEAAVPLLLPELLPQDLERVLFLDADTLVLGDLAELWETPLDHEVLAAAPDAAVPLCSSPRGVKGWQQAGFSPQTPYFNCGVLLIHLPRWREREIARRARHYLESARAPVDFLHQEALNAVLWDSWKPLDPRWNLLASHAGRPYGRIAPHSWRRPGIVHFAGRMKPWRAPAGGPFNSPYQKVLDRILPQIPRKPPTAREQMYSIYDRYFRTALFPIEQFLWRRRLI